MTSVGSSSTGPQNQHHQAGYDSWLTGLYIVRHYASQVKNGKISEADLLPGTEKRCKDKPEESLFSALFRFNLGEDGKNSSVARLWEDDINHICALATEDKVWNINEYLK